VRRPRVLVMIDQVTRDAVSQLLIAHYLRWRGARVYLCNQGTIRAMFERHRPDVVFSSWLVGGPIMTFLQQIHTRTRIVLVDQEGGRIGAESFKRAFFRFGGIKAEVAKVCARVLTWGTAQAQWLRELDVLRDDQILVTGSPRFDPYLVPAAPAADRYLGVTLRGDQFTAMPSHIMWNIFQQARTSASDGISVGYPLKAQHEDRLWHVAAGTRYMFKVLLELTRHGEVPIVVRPGPWEQAGVYHFLRRDFPRLTVDPTATQPSYIRGAFAILDEYSSLGLEGLLVGTPVISTQSLIPRLEEHIGGNDGHIFNAAYVKHFYWRPQTVEEAVDLVLRARAGNVAATPNPAPLAEYLAQCHGWPRRRPSSFATGDAILEVADAPLDRVVAEFDPRETGDRLWRAKGALYRRVPGAHHLAALKMQWQALGARDRELYRRYHYFPWLYPNHAEVAAMFAGLLARSGEAR
jgi:surface carbohydrate biosynthesis protein